MPRKALGDRPLTAAERQAKQRERRAAIAMELRVALGRIVIEARTIHEARQIATIALDAVSTVDAQRIFNHHRSTSIGAKRCRTTA